MKPGIRILRDVELQQAKLPNTSDSQMRSTDVVILGLYSIGMSIGQLLFKMSAGQSSRENGQGFLSSVLANGYFLSAVALYASLTIVWVWILTRVPLSRAYPFVVLAFVFTPLLAALVFGESLNRWYFGGLTLILLGLGVLVWKAG